MATIGSFGDVTFETSSKKILTFNDFTREGSSRWAKHDILGHKPITEFLGPDQEEISLSIKFSVFMGVNPEKELSKLRTFRDTGKVAPFILGGSPISSSWWCLETLREGLKTVDNKGRIIIAEANLTLREYPRPPVQTDKAKPPKKQPVKDNNTTKRGPIGIVTVTASRLNVRAGPSLNAKILKTLKKTQRYKAYGKVKTDIEWYAIGAGQYVSARYVTFEKKV